MLKMNLTYANTLHDQATELCDKGRHGLANNLFDQALQKVTIYKEQYGYTRSTLNIEVADSIASKIYRAKGDLNRAQEIMREYRDSNDPYTVYEQAILWVLKSDDAAAQQRYGDALGYIQEAIACIHKYKYELTPQLQTLFDSALYKEQQIRDGLGI